MDSTGYMTCALKVDTQTVGWHKSLTKILKNIAGVTYSIDAQQGIAYVSGKIDPDKLLEMLQKSAKHIELHWVDSGNHTANSPRMPSNGCMHHRYDPYYNAYGCPYTYRMRDPYLDGPQQNSWCLYPEPYSAPGIPFYEPLPPEQFPQPPATRDDFNVGDEHWCSVM